MFVKPINMKILFPQIPGTLLTAGLAVDGRNLRPWNDDMDERSTERINKFNVYLTNGAMYSNWKPYKHPLYGNIEI